VVTLNFTQSLPDLSPFSGNLSGAGYVAMKTRAAVLRVPLSRGTNGWLYRGQIIRSGGALTIETEDYLVRGLIVRVVMPAAANGRTESVTPK
jgi:hypothetical protein